MPDSLIPIILAVIGVIATVVNLISFLSRITATRRDTIFEASIKRNEATFDATIASNKDLATRLDASNERGIKLADANAKFQDEILAQNKKIEILNDKVDARDASIVALQDKNHRLDKEILELDKGQFELNKKFTELSSENAAVISERDRLLLENKLLTDEVKQLRDDLTAIILRNDGLEAMVLELRADIDKFRKDRDARVEMSAQGADKAAAERLLREAKATMIQAGDAPEDKAS